MNKVIRYIKKFLNTFEKNMKKNSLVLFVVLLFVFMVLFKNHTLEKFENNDNLELEIVNKK